ncbi:MAG: transcriptional regulator [Galactobacter sp.]|uniref:helix-turn-helix domain-containing protein n=1 Tax=Galactobacter sp. TaxID=2676125 RepID=UPI0025BC980C|nr:helix-turn-helix domain-containing protein [Galactobacter sp.]
MDSFSALDQLADGRDLRTAPPLVQASLLRSRTAFVDPTRATVRSILGADELEEYRSGHQLATVLPLIRSLLSTPAKEHGLIMAVGDEAGRLLWVEGDAGTRGRAEDMAFLPGADWSESSMGTSAPAIAIATGAAVQVRREEHFAPQVTEFCCSAVPLRDPVNGNRIGFLDLTGGDRAADSLILPYLRSTAEAVQSHLAAQVQAAKAQAERRERDRATARVVVGPSAARPARATKAAPRLSVTGQRPPALRTATGQLPLSRRHAEILAVLAKHPAGLDTAELAAAIYPTPVTPVTIRAEVTRLRKVLAKADLDSQIQLSSRPYRVTGLEVDAVSVETLLGRGSHVQALNEYAGTLLPESEAPAILTWREELAATLREAVLADASAETLLKYLRRPEATDDVEAWTLALKLLPARSPKRAAVLAHLDRIDT